jgi:hypothetical protein
MAGNSQVSFKPFSSGARFSPQFAQTIANATKGGAPTQAYLQQYANDQNDMQGLIAQFQSPNPGWINGTLADGTPATFLRSGNAFVAIATTPLTAAEVQTLDLSGATYSQCVHVLFGTSNASTISKIAVYTFDAAAGALIAAAVNPFISAVINRLKDGLTSWAARMNNANRVNGEGEADPEAEQDVENSLDGPLDFENVEFDINLDFTAMDGLALVGSGILTLLGWALVFAIVFFALEYLTSLLFKTFNVVVNVFNITDQSLSTTVNYTYNIENTQPGTTNQNVLYPVNDVGPSPFSNFTPTDPVVNYGTFVFTNDTGLEGLGVLMAVGNCTKNTTSTLKNAMLTVDVTWAFDNSISAWFNETSTDWETLYDNQEGVNRVLSLTSSAGNYTAYMSTNALQGATNEQYVVNAVIADNSLYSNFLQYANSVGNQAAAAAQSGAVALMALPAGHAGAAPPVVPHPAVAAWATQGHPFTAFRRT